MDSIFVSGVSYAKLEADKLGKCSLKDGLASSFESYMLNAGASESVVLSTCNRVEIYYSAESSLRGSIHDGFSKFGRSAEIFSENADEYEGLNAIRHLFEVASGFDSQMTGETEILGQVKDAYLRALADGHSGAKLNTVFQKAAQCGKWVRTNTEIGRGKISVGSVSAELAERIFADLKSARILLLGSGEVGTLIAQSLHIRGASDISIASRTFENAENLARKIKCRSLEMSEALSSLGNYDIIMCALASERPVITKSAVASAIAARKRSAVFLIDLGMPRCVEASCGELDEAYLYTLDDLSKIAEENIRGRRAQIDEGRRHIEERAKAVFDKVMRDARTITTHESGNSEA